MRCEELMNKKYLDPGLGPGSSMSLLAVSTMGCSAGGRQK